MRPLKARCDASIPDLGHSPAACRSGRIPSHAILEEAGLARRRGVRRTPYLWTGSDRSVSRRADLVITPKIRRDRPEARPWMLRNSDRVFRAPSP